MSAVTHVCTIDYVAKMLDEDVELLEAIAYNNDNLTYGSIRLIPLRPAVQDVVIGGCSVRDVLQLFSYARPLEIRSPDVAPSLRGAFSR